MKALKLLLPVLIILGFTLSSCTKQSETDKDKKSEQTDTLAQKLDPAVESVFANANPVSAADTAIAPVEFRSQLNEVLLEYIEIKQALSNNDSTKALMKTNQIKRTLTNIKDSGLNDKLKEEWKKESEKIEKCCKEVTISEKLESQRKAFSKMTDIMTGLAKKFGFKNRTVYLMYCADKKAGYWLVDTKDIGNPYLGKTDKPCVELKEAWKFQ